MKKTKKQIQKFEKQLEQIVNNISAEIVAETLSNPKWKGGKAIKYIYVATVTLIAKQIIDKSGYMAAVKELVKSSGTMLTDIESINTINGIKSAFVGNAKILQALEQVDLKVFTGLSDDMLNKLQRTLSDVVLNGLSDKAMIKQIQGIVSDDFQRYVKAYAQTSRTSYLQQLEDITADRFGSINEPLYWEYVGAEDNKNRDICIEALDQRFFTEDERQQFELINGTRYNCRHIFVNITSDAYDTKEVPESDLTQEEKDRREKIIEVMNA